MNSTACGDLRSRAQYLLVSLLLNLIVRRRIDAVQVDVFCSSFDSGGESTAAHLSGDFCRWSRWPCSSHAAHCS